MPSRNEVMYEIKKIYKEIDNLEFLIEIAIMAEVHKQVKSKKTDDRQVLLFNSLPSLRQ